jgi:4-phospho-D-threonate 3-dehydrogenase / 4-phospho-D-erythronate 3-dehydrogenase
MKVPPDAVSRRPLIGITMGDPLGVGPEVIVKALADPEVRELARYVVFGFHDALELAADQCETGVFWWREPYDGSARVGSGVLVADFDDLPLPTRDTDPGPDQHAGRASFRFVEEALRHARSGELDAIVTAPICKESWMLANQRYAGHTEFLARRFDTRRVAMMFAAGDLRVALASDHVPLFDLRHRFTIGMVHQPIDLLDRALREWWGIEEPRIGVLGINPHAGEGGLLGDEEQRIIEPALTLARNGGIRVTGPLPADTAFTPDVRSGLDGIVAMYHDQGLIPVKMIAFHSAVNVTLGLPIVRTSPDHGTAFNIVGRNKAHPGSMKEAIRLAVWIAERRRAAACATQADGSRRPA